jgi:hypothetical protein
MPLEDCGCEDILNNNCAESPIEINTVTCSSNVVCKTTNWTKCIIYDGPTLGCASTVGKVNAFTHEGEAGDAGVYTATGLAATGGTGTGATFNVTGNALNTTYAVVVNNVGTGYKVGDVLTIAGNLIQGSFTSPANDVTITITSLTDAVVITSPLITANQTLSTILANLNARICALTPEGLNYSGFNYSCLRVGGNLESTGTAITTAQQFTEAAASALCSLNARLKVLEIPDVDADCITSITGGETLIEVLDAMIAEICIVKEFQQLPITTTANCFTTVPISSVDISAWFQWIVDNTCAIKTALESSISTQTTRINNINTYLHGSNSPAYPITYNTSCYGGSATANVHTTLTSLIAEVCTINTTLGTIPDLSAIVLTWATCFSGSPYTYTNAAQTLQTQLERILNVISREKITFSGDFTVVDSACGKSVSLAGSSSFACSMLASCTIGNLGDVDLTGISLHNTLKWDGTKFIAVADDTFNNIGIVNKAGGYSSAPIGFYHQAVDPLVRPRIFNTGFVERSWCLTSDVIYTSEYYNLLNSLQVKVNWDGNIYFKGNVLSRDTSLLDIFATNGVTIGTLPANYFPSTAVVIAATVSFYDVNLTDGPLVLPCNITISISGQMIIYLNPGDSTQVADIKTYITSVGGLDNTYMRHAISFTGKAIYQ